ncbi:MAG: flagellar type III secretion system pore protein FliP [Candidatus Brocadia sp.]|nr:flagellar type III secretion system pore protein FliP [Candidatus Brocadia sp.]NUO07145.1 flagellar type III secretion system pore protein FliP [Candidatus Brocadia sp.]
MRRWLITLIVCGMTTLFCCMGIVDAAGESSTPLKLTMSIDNLGKPKEIASTLKIVLFLTVLSLLPGLLLTMTSFTRIIIVLSFVRKALSFQTLPPNQILIGISLFLTFFVMAPVWKQVNSEAIQPYIKEEITQNEALVKGLVPFQKFMLKQTREKDIALFMNIAKMEKPKSAKDVPMHIIIPAFITSELKTSFQMGFLLFLPFLVIDMVVACVLTAMGMVMLPPAMISLPFKLILFVLVDGWQLIIQSLISSIT